jgi:hypothetical protein
MVHRGPFSLEFTKGWLTVKKLFALILAAFMGTALVSAPMGCNKDEKKPGTPAKDEVKDKAPAKDKAPDPPK